jgi:hypothetical protein
LTCVQKLIQCEREKLSVFIIRKDQVMPKGVRLKPEQIVAKLREIGVKMGQGKDVLTACREAGATDKSYCRWRRDYGA